MQTKRIGIYPGTFDQITSGHLDILSRAAKIVDESIIAISTSYIKTPMFTIRKRVEFASTYLKTYNIDSNVRVLQFDRLLVNFVKLVGANVIIRALASSIRF